MRGVVGVSYVGLMFDVAVSMMWLNSLKQLGAGRSGFVVRASPHAPSVLERTIWYVLHTINTPLTPSKDKRYGRWSMAARRSVDGMDMHAFKQFIIHCHKSQIQHIHIISENNTIMMSWPWQGIKGRGKVQKSMKNEE
jgi:hypothetical protein